MHRSCQGSPRRAAPRSRSRRIPSGKFPNASGCVPNPQVCLGVGGGKIRLWETGWKGTLTGAGYATLVQGPIATALAKMEQESGVKPALLRDKAPQSDPGSEGAKGSQGVCRIPRS